MSKDKLLSPSTADWIEWGKVDPLYAVATVKGRSLADERPWTDADFYALGKDWDAFKARWQRYGVTGESCVEIGCGAGRLTHRIALDFKHVYGIDVSADQIAYARSHVPANVSFHVTDGATIPLPDDSTSGVFSTHVFQHFESLEAALVNFREIHRVLSQGGSMMIHLPVVLWPSGMLSEVLPALERAKKQLAEIRCRAIRWAFSKGLVRFPMARYTSYDVRQLHVELTRIGFVDVEVALIFLPGMHPCVLARKSSRPL